MQAFLISTAAVAIAEIGDKTQLLSLVLAAKYRRPLPICLGILVATLANHALAGWFGAAAAGWLTPDVLKWIIVVSFLGIGLWTLVPDKLDDVDGAMRRHGSVFVTTIIAFFIAEMGDKTQVATVVLGAQYEPLWQVVAGTTVGMLLANVPVVWLGARFADRLPLRATRLTAAVLFIALAIWVALN